MNVKELIEELKTFPPEMQVAYALHSEYVLLEKGGIEVVEACEPRPDGWIHSRRPDKPKQKYVMFPGN